MQITRRHIAMISLCLYLAALGFLCFGNPQNYPSTPLYLWNIPADKIAHFIMFAPYPALAFISIDPQSGSIMKKLITLFLVLTTGVSLALCTEIIQGTMEYRSFEFWDLAADIAGMLTCTMALAAYILSKNRKRHQNE